MYRYIELHKVLYSSAFINILVVYCFVIFTFLFGYQYSSCKGHMIVNYPKDFESLPTDEVTALDKYRHVCEENESLQKGQALLAAIARTLTKTISFHEKVDTILSLTGKALGVSRVYIFEDDNEEQITVNTFEWCNEKIHPEIDNLQAIPMDFINDWYRLMGEQGYVNTSNIQTLPRNLRLVLEPQNVISIVVFKLQLPNGGTGFAGFDECVAERIWQRHELDILISITGIISSLYEQGNLQKQLLETQKGLLSTLELATGYRHKETGEHVIRTKKLVALLVGLVALLFPEVLDAELVELIVETSSLHDIGKISIPDSILLKPGSLTDEEYAIIKSHPVIGHDLIEEALARFPRNKFLQTALQMASYHHEHWDGTGYPYGLKGEEIPLPARLMAIADVYEAMTCDRVYRKGIDHAQVIRSFTQGDGRTMPTHFDPTLLAVFLEHHQEFAELAV